MLGGLSAALVAGGVGWATFIVQADEPPGRVWVCFEPDAIDESGECAVYDRPDGTRYPGTFEGHRQCGLDSVPSNVFRSDFWDRHEPSPVERLLDAVGIDVPRPPGWAFGHSGIRTTVDGRRWGMFLGPDAYDSALVESERRLVGRWRHRDNELSHDGQYTGGGMRGGDGVYVEMELTFRDDRSVVTSEGHHGHWYADADMISISWNDSETASLGRDYVVNAERTAFHLKWDETVRATRAADDD